MTRSRLASVLAATALLAACSTVKPPKPSPTHIQADNVPPAAATIPRPVEQTASLPKPRALPRVETYSVVVNNIRVQELLFALARDAKLNVDIHAGISGTVTLNAIDQTLPQLLNRIAKQVDMRYELDGPNLVVMPDSPFLRTYKIDYVNMSREVSGTVAINTQIATSQTATGSGTGTTSATGGNTGTTEVKNQMRNRFWESLERNIKDMLRETDKILPEGTSETETVTERSDTQSTTGTGAMQSGGTTVVKRTTFREAASVIVNPETGIVSVRATSRQHEKVQEFIDQVTTSARRQVMIEATIAEVSLSENYQQGIDWLYLRNAGSQVAIGQGGQTQIVRPDGSFASLSSTLNTNITQSVFSLAFRNGGFTAVIRLIEAFGTVKILSSPKLSVLNNQTALLKVVDNRVFFTIEATQTTVTSGGTVVPSTITAKPNTVAVGLVMAVTPQIGENDAIVLNVRPTVTRITNMVQDPTPALAIAGVANLVPEIQTREMESVMRISNGDIAVLGGLMQDEVDYRTDAIPGLSRLPGGIGNFFSYRNDTNKKTELVIFLRPVVIRSPDIQSDYRSLAVEVPDDKFFVPPARPPLDFGTRP